MERGVLRHAATKREATFGQLADAAAKLPAPDNVQLKDPKNFKLIGREGAVHKLDAPSKVNGTAQFTIDIREPNMLTVVVAHPERFGATVARVDDAEARKVPGVVDVKVLPSGVAVYANGMWPALKARDLLKITWDDSKAEKRGTQQLLEEYRALSRKPGTVAGKHGDADAALSKAGKVIEAEYIFPYLAHAPMEPLDGYLQFDGDRAVARFGSQIQTLDQGTIAGVLGLKPEQVEIQTMLARRQLRPPGAARGAFCGGTGDGRQGHRSGPAGETGLDARGRFARRLLPAAVRASPARRRAGRQDRRRGRTPWSASPS